MSEARVIRRPKGARFKRHVWIDKQDEMWPIEAMTDSHLFFVMRTLEKWAGSNRFTDQQVLRDAISKGRMPNGNPIDRKTIDAKIDWLTKASLKALAQHYFPLWTDILCEFRRRKVDPFSDKTAMESRKAYEAEQAWRNRQGRGGMRL